MSARPRCRSGGPVRPTFAARAAAELAAAQTQASAARVASGLHRRPRAGGAEDPHPHHHHVPKLASLGALHRGSAAPHVAAPLSARGTRAGPAARRTGSSAKRKVKKSNAASSSASASAAATPQLPNAANGSGGGGGSGVFHEPPPSLQFLTPRRQRGTSTSDSPPSSRRSRWAAAGVHDAPAPPEGAAKRPASPPRIWRDDETDAAMHEHIARLVLSPAKSPPLDRQLRLEARLSRHDFPPLSLFDSADGSAAATGAAAAAAAAAARARARVCERPYLLTLNPNSGSVFVEIHRQLAALPFWKAVEYDRMERDVKAAAKATIAKPAGRSAVVRLLNNVHLLLDERYTSDSVIGVWTKLKDVERWQRGAAAACADSESRRLLVNSYSGTRCLTLKGAMIKTIAMGSRTPWEITPQTFVLNAPCHGADQRSEFVRTYNKGAKESRDASFKNIWIVKPSHRNKGIGIKVFDTVRDTLGYVDSGGDGELDNGKATQYVAQKYIERPFLIGGRKFDLRSWCVVTANFDILVYQKGVMRTASERYDPRNLANELSHLTNHCIQETGPNFGRFEEGNEMWYDQFQQYLDGLPRGTVGHGWSLYEDLLPQVNTLIKKTLLISKKKMSSSAVAADGDGLGCFQLFGFDFMVDEDAKVWLIEVNGSPASAEYLLEGMMGDLLTAVVEPMFPAPAGFSYPTTPDNQFMKIYTNPSPPKVCAAPNPPNFHPLHTHTHATGPLSGASLHRQRQHRPARVVQRV